MSFRNSALGLASLALATLFAGGALAQDSVKIGLILPMTGPQASTGKQIDAGVRANGFGSKYLFAPIAFRSHGLIRKVCNLSGSCSTRAPCAADR